MRVARSCPTLRPHGLYSPGNSPAQNTGVGSCSLLQGLFPTQGSYPGIEPRSPALQTDSLPAEPLGNPQNTGVGSLSLLQGIFQTQELTQGLLYRRQILYQLSQQGRLDKGIDIINKLEVSCSLKRLYTYCIPGTGTKSGDNNNE